MLISKMLLILLVKKSGSWTEMIIYTLYALGSNISCQYTCWHIWYHYCLYFNICTD